MVVLVIGGSGFIGAPLTRALIRQGHDVFVVHRGETPAPLATRQFLCPRGELSRLRADLSGDVLDAVVDLIAYTESDALETVRTFADLTRHLVVASSADVYRAYGRLTKSDPGPPEPVPIRESAPLRTKLHPYRFSHTRSADAPRWLADYEKILVEKVFASASIPATILRLGMVYGPGDRQRRFWPMIRRMLDGRPVLPLESGWASWRGPFCFVENAAAALALAATRPGRNGHTYNVADSPALTILEYADRLRSTVDWSGAIRVLEYAHAPMHMRRASDALDLHQHLILDSSRIRNELQYVEPFDTAHALEATVEAERALLPRSGPSPEAEYRAEDEALATIASNQ